MWIVNEKYSVKNLIEENKNVKTENNLKKLTYEYVCKLKRSDPLRRHAVRSIVMLCLVIYIDVMRFDVGLDELNWMYLQMLMGIAVDHFRQLLRIFCN